MHVLVERSCIWNLSIYGCSSQWSRPAALLRVHNARRCRWPLPVRGFVRWSLQVGAVLLERGRRGVSLTPAGGVLLRHARQLQRQAEALQLELGGYGGGGQVTLRLAANTAALSAWLPERLADFLIAHPQLDLALTEQGSDEAADAVREERADIAVVAGHADLSGLQVLPFREDRLVLVMAAAHPLAGAATLQLSEPRGNGHAGAGRR